jgi:hypothetical protein
VWLLDFRLFGLAFRGMVGGQKVLFEALKIYNLKRKMC